MKRRIALVLAFAAWIGLGPGSNSHCQGQSHNSSQVLPKRSALERIGLEKPWYLNVPLSARSERVTKINLSNNLIFVQTNMGMLHVLDAETGSPQWSTKISSSTTNPQPVVSTSKLVLIANQLKIYAFDRQTGRSMFIRSLRSTVSTGLVASEDRLLVGRMDGIVSSFSIDLNPKPYVLDNGEEVDRPVVSEHWNFATVKPIISRPLATSRVAVLADRKGKLHAISNMDTVIGSAAGAKTLYRFPTNGDVVGDLATLGTRTILASSMSGALYAVDLYTGDLIWHFPTPAPIAQEPLTSNGFIYVQNTKGEIFALDLNKFWAIETPTGQIVDQVPADRKADAQLKVSQINSSEEAGGLNVSIRANAQWRLNAGTGTLLAVSPKKLYGRDANGSLFIIGRDRGNMIASANDMLDNIGLDLRPFSQTTVNSVNDRMYFATSDGLIVCLREIGLDQPASLRDPNSKPFGYLPDLDDPKKDAKTPKDNASANPADGASTPAADPNASPTSGDSANENPKSEKKDAGNSEDKPGAGDGDGGDKNDN